MHTKRISSGYGKGHKWVVTPNPRLKKKESIPLMLIVRDILKFADNSRETKKIIHDKLIFVDKKVITDPKYGVGLMDIVEIPKIKKYFRVLPGKKGLHLKEITEDESNMKLLRIMNKSVEKNGNIQLNLHDGSNIRLDKNKYSTNDTLVVKLPKREIQDSIEFKKGNLAMVVKGRHSGDISKINDVLKGTTARKSLTTVGTLQTLTDYIFVIGTDKPVISV